MTMTLRWLVLVLLPMTLGAIFAEQAFAWQAANYFQTVLEAIYPAGARQGTSVTVRLTGAQGGLDGALGLIVDGPPGVTVESFKQVSAGEVEATLIVAADAKPGMRMIRVRGGKSGLTNFRYFQVGGLPEHIEKESNTSPDNAEQVTMPSVINGQIKEALDQDCFRFRAKAGQKVVAAVCSHRLDAMGYARNTTGYFDANLEILDENGSVLAESGDALGFDPLIHFTVPSDGEYVVRVGGVAYNGFPQAVYRLTLGEVPYPIAAFPAGGQRGQSVNCELIGPNVPPGTKLAIEIPLAGAPYPVTEAMPEVGGHLTNSLTFVAGEFPEVTVAEDHDSRDKAIALECPRTVNARFMGTASEHWYKISLKADERVTLEVASQRYLRSPLDTLLEVYDVAGRLIAANDDGEIFASECVHDFVPFDSRLELSVKEAGEYFIRVAEQTGRRGPLAAYRLTVHPTIPDFRLHQFPDATPVWGAGGTATVCVEATRLGDLAEDIELTVEGLSDGWTGSRCWSLASEYRVPRGAFGAKSFLTITAPESAKVGDVADFRIVGRAWVGDKTIEHVALPLTLYMWQEPNHFRVSQTSRAAVAPRSGPLLTSSLTELEAKPGAKIELPVEIHYLPGEEKKELSLTVNYGKTHFQCALRPPHKLDPGTTSAKVPLEIPATWKPGTYCVVVALAWASETRKGLPGPCTRLIQLRVPEAK